MVLGRFENNLHIMQYFNLNFSIFRVAFVQKITRKDVLKTKDKYIRPFP
jgi:hypothetical protein